MFNNIIYSRKKELKLQFYYFVDLFSVAASVFNDSIGEEVFDLPNRWLLACSNRCSGGCCKVCYLFYFVAKNPSCGFV